MIDDNTPRGLVQMSDYLKVRRELEQVREELAYANWRLGDGAGDDERCVIAGARLKIRRGEIKYVLRLVRSAPMPVLVSDQIETTRVIICRLRSEIKKAGGDPKMIQTIDSVGYMIKRSDLPWFEVWVPELFRPLGDVMGERQLADYHRDTRGNRGKQDPTSQSGVR